MEIFLQEAMRKIPLFSTSLPLIAAVGLGGLFAGSLSGAEAFRMGVLLSDSSEGNISTGFSNLVGGGGPIAPGFAYRGKELGAILPLTTSANPLENHLYEVAAEITLLSAIPNLGVTFNLYKVDGITGLPIEPALYTISDTFNLAAGQWELFFDSIPSIDGLFDLDGETEVALTLWFNNLPDGQGGLSFNVPSGDGIERDFDTVGLATDGEFETIITIPPVIPETSTVFAGAFMALACGGLYLKRRRA